ncbi:MAG: 2-hydroxyacid dehydrogenase [Paludibacteraceae bacterium]|mgnify:CR=1 FL=1|jgi:D-3-phosphoglycerate dehydrogenase|nr:2-hydroxyacid dehydrogenase [Paludibacteraceae bacterium]MEE0911376.1 2-hydroxyacid dehydrogenase [Paludibacteraceae bacterium]
MPKILHTYRYTGRPWEILQSVVPEGYTIKTLDTPTYEQLVKEAEDADYFLVSGRLPIDKGVLDAAKKLKMIQRTGVGTEMLDKEEIKQRGIPVYVNAGVNARSVAEHTLALMLSCLKRIPAIDKQVRQGIWKKQETGTSCHELYGKTVGLVGMGAIGRQVAEYLHVFGAKILYTDLCQLSSEQEQKLYATYISSLEEMLPLVDILSFHCPLTNDNKEILNERTLSMMKSDAIIVNTARGKLIEEVALYKALKNGKVRAAGLDVHYEEPISINNHLLSTSDNVILTPHIGGLSFETFHAMMKDAVENIVLYEEGNTEMLQNKLL